MPDLSQNQNSPFPSAKEAETSSSPPAKINFEHYDAAQNAGSKRKFWFAVVLTSAAVAFAIGAGAFGARYVTINWRILNAARLELYNLEKQNKEISRALGDTHRLDPKLKFINSSFVNPSSPLPFIESIEDLGRKTGVDTELSLISGPDNAQNYMLTATGEFGKTMSFFKNLEMLPFLFELQESEISALDEKEKGENVTAKSEHSVRLNTVLKPFAP